MPKDEKKFKNEVQVRDIYRGHLQELRVSYTTDSVDLYNITAALLTIASVLKGVNDEGN